MEAEDRTAAADQILPLPLARLSQQPSNSISSIPNLNSTTVPHALLLLADSALPLGSFAFSSGLESYLGHHKPFTVNRTAISVLHHFLRFSVVSLAGTVLPYLLAAFRSPAALARLDNDLDASTLCTVARRASIAQGRALLGVWERALQTAQVGADGGAGVALAELSGLLRLQQEELGANGHFAPIWALVCRSMQMVEEQMVYVFLFNHAKAVMSAAVRAGVLGPYQAQSVLASAWLQELIAEVIRSNWHVAVEDAGQHVPLMDLWLGRHELLYSRIFNS